MAAQPQALAADVAISGHRPGSGKGSRTRAEKLKPGADKTKLFRDAVQALAAIGKVESEHRHEALLLRRETVGKLGTGGTLSFEESLAMAAEAVAEKNWNAAEPLYRQAIELATKANDAKKQETAKSGLAQVQYKQALVQFASDDMEKVLALAGQIVGANPGTQVAEDASALAVAAALQAFVESKPDAKEASLARLQKVADVALKTWPDKPVGDDARMAVAQAALLRGELPQALEQLAKVNSQSKRYPTALQILGQVKWKQYVEAKKAADAAGNADEIQKLRKEAVSSLQTSVERQKASWQSTSEPMPASLFDTQLLLAETYLEAEQPKEAAALLRPLVDSIKAAKPTTVDLKMQRVLFRAAQAQIAAGDATKSADAVTTLTSLTRDEPQSNGVLADVARLVTTEIKRQEAEGAEGAAPNATAPTAPAPATMALRDLAGRMLDELAGRKQLSVQQLIFVGDACMSLERNDKARDVYQRLLDTIDKDQAAKATAGAAITRIRSRLVGLLRSEGKLDEAFKQVNALIEAHPSALEPLMEKGYILQNLAERDPKRYDACVSHWTDLRLRLSRMKTRPPEYYEVLYNAALCLVRQARQSNNKEKALDAEKMLKSTLTLSPQLSGPDMVAKYQTLLAAAITARGGTPPPATPAGAAINR